VERLLGVDGTASPSGTASRTRVERLRGETAATSILACGTALLNLSGTAWSVWNGSDGVCGTALLVLQLLSTSPCALIDPFSLCDLFGTSHGL
jgi:hypothetical protein